MVRLEESLSVTQDRIVVDYRLENPTAVDFFVLDAIYTLEEGRPVVRDSLVYTQIQGDTLTLFRAALEIPPGVQVEAPEMPYARRLPAGSSLSGRIEAKLPLAYNNPYDFSGREETVACQRVRLVVGDIASQDLAETPAKVDLRGVDLYRISYRAAMSAQKLAESPVYQSPVIVYKRP